MLKTTLSILTMSLMITTTGWAENSGGPTLAPIRLQTISCRAEEGRIAGTIRFAIQLNAQGKMQKDEWGHATHFPIPSGKKTVKYFDSVVFVTDVKAEKTENERKLRNFWLLKNASGRFLPVDDAKHYNASANDLFFYGGDSMDMNQATLFLFAKTNYTTGEYRFEVNGEEHYKTPLKCVVKIQNVAKPAGQD